jgi:leucyl aminopeptidase
MTDFSPLLVPDQGQTARLIHLVDKNSFEAWIKSRSAEDRALISAQRFDGKAPFQFVILPRGGEFEVVSAVKNSDDLSPWCIAKLAQDLPSGTYKLAGGEPGRAALGWLLSQHRYEDYLSKKDDVEESPRVLLSGQAAAIEPALQLARATILVRDLVNTPAADLGPAELEASVRKTATEMGATVRVTSGEELARDYPLIAAVGRAAGEDRAPRLIELEWGRTEDPRVAIVGKGVCFDSGGLDLKSAAGMRLMKKDMGGAAHALALCYLSVAARLPIRIHLLIPAVENAVSGNALRPGDVVRSRKGLFVEIDNTDAEGRLILADALARAIEDAPDLVIDFATLTGAARVALGPDLPAFFCNSDGIAAQAAECSSEVEDPIWRMPLWDSYDEMLKSDIADMANAANSPMAGCIVAAMFLKRFVAPDVSWAHLDTYAWRDTAKPGRPKGGEALGLRAMFALLKKRYLQS